MKTEPKGQMLIEVVVAIGIIVLILVGTSDLTTRSLRAVTFQKQKDEAVLILQKLLNDYRSQRDSDPAGFYSTVTSEVIDPCIAGKPYKCTVLVDKTADAVTLTAMADWDEGGKTLSVKLVESLARTIK